MEEDFKLELNKPVVSNKGTHLTRLVKMRVLRYLKANGFSQGILQEAAQFQNVDYTDAVFCKLLSVEFANKGKLFTFYYPQLT